MRRIRLLIYGWVILGVMGLRGYAGQGGMVAQRVVMGGVGGTTGRLMRDSGGTAVEVPGTAAGRVRTAEGNVRTAEGSVRTAVGRVRTAAEVPGTVRIISGQVFSADDRSVLEGVTVVVKGGSMISGTQIDGAYYIPVGVGDSVLTFSMKGYETQEVRLGDLNQYTIWMHKGVVGCWRGEFRVRADLAVPFNFEIKRGAEGGLRVYFLNAEERFDEGRVEQRGDSVYLWLDQFDNEIALVLGGDGRLRGVLRRQDGKGSEVPVTAEAGKGFRFADHGMEAAGNITGTYAIRFVQPDGKEEDAVGLWRQDGRKLRGTFLHVTGDSRYLEGVVVNDSFYLSSFIGSMPGYYRGRFDGRGHLVSPRDEKYKGKVVVNAIGGTWYPNCLDEAGFLSSWYKANRRRGGGSGSDLGLTMTFCLVALPTSRAWRHHCLR